MPFQLQISTATASRPAVFTVDETELKEELDLVTYMHTTYPGYITDVTVGYIGHSQNNARSIETATEDTRTIEVARTIEDTRTVEHARIIEHPRTIKEVVAVTEDTENTAEDTRTTEDTRTAEDTAASAKADEDTAAIAKAIEKSNQFLEKYLDT